jgi:hypothetical protein
MKCFNTSEASGEGKEGRNAASGDLSLFPHTLCDVQMQSVDLCLFVKAKFLVFVIFLAFWGASIRGKHGSKRFNTSKAGGEKKGSSVIKKTETLSR